MVITIPDEDLYEQGVFPSRFNDDHKATFTIAKSKSWSPKSINVFDLANSLPGGQIISLQLQDIGYDRRLMSHGRQPASFLSRFFAKIYGLICRRFDAARLISLRRFLTTFADDASC